MDVYIGGSGPIAENARRSVGERLSQIVPEHRNLSLASEAFGAWGDGTGEVRHVVVEDFEVLFDGYLHRYEEPDLNAALVAMARRVIEGSAPLNGNSSGLFNLTVREHGSGRTHIANDPGGLLPLHIAHRGRELVVSSHLNLAAKALGAEPDPLAIAAKLTLSHPLGVATYFQGIDRLAPGQVLVHDPSTGRLLSRYSETYFDGWEEPSGNVADLVWERLLDACRPLVETHMPVGLMLSEGYDSRLVGGVLHHLGVPLHTFTHGTTGTLGSTIAQRVADRVDAEHRFHDLDQGFPADITELRRQLTLTDNLHVPFWSHGADFLSAGPAAALTTGYALDTTLGGHAFATGGSSLTKARSTVSTIARQSMGRLDNSEIEVTAEAIIARLPRIDLDAAQARARRFLDGDAAETVASAVPDLPEAIAAEVQRIRDNGSPLASSALQRYFLENRVRRYSFGQELTLRAKAPLVIPSFEPTLMRTLGNVPPSLRVGHRVYLDVFRRHLRPLARTASGAHGLPPVLPRGLLEASRFGWKLRENRLTARYLQQPGRFRPRSHRGVLFAEHSARLAPRFALEDLLGRDDTPLNRASLQLSIDKIRRHEIRIYLPLLYLGLELTDIWADL